MIMIGNVEELVGMDDDQRVKCPISLRHRLEGCLFHLDSSSFYGCEMLKLISEHGTSMGVNSPSQS